VIQNEATKLDPPDVLVNGLDLLRSLLPRGWQLTLEPPQAGVDSRPDATLVRVDVSGGHMLRILVEARRDFTPRDVGSVLGGRTDLIRQVAGQVAVMVIAPWLSPQTRQKLADQNINYLDLAGNLRIVQEYPPVYIEREVPRDQAPRRSRTEPRLGGIQAGRVVRLLADVAPPYGVVELAQAATVTPGYMSRLLDTLDRDGLLERGKRGVVLEVDWANLLRRRAEYYSIFETNQVAMYVCPNGAAFAREILGDLARVGDLPTDLALTGSFAATAIAPVAAPALLALYASGNTDPFIEQARLVPADEGANVVILRPYSTVVLERPYIPPPTTSVIRFVGLSQLALDCLTGNGRMPAEGEALLGWMAENLDAWRLKTLADATGQS
jgi:hypothetical protein